MKRLIILILQALLTKTLNYLCLLISPHFQLTNKNLLFASLIVRTFIIKFLGFWDHSMLVVLYKSINKVDSFFNRHKFKYDNSKLTGPVNDIHSL